MLSDAALDIAYQHMGGGARQQRNKAHKRGKHSAPSNRNLRNSRRSVALSTGRAVGKQAGRSQRRKRKAERLREQQRQRRAADGRPPKVVAVVQLTEDALPERLLPRLGLPAASSSTLPLPAHRMRLHFVHVPIASGPPSACADAAKVADCLLLLVSTASANVSFTLSAKAASNLHVLRLHGHLPAVCALDGLHALPTHSRSHVLRSTRSLLARFLQQHDARLVGADSPSAPSELIRSLCNCQPSPPSWRSSRPYLLCQYAELETSHNSATCLALHGYVRGQSFSADQLVHLPDRGEFQLQRIDVLCDPYPLKLKHRACAHARPDGDTDMESNRCQQCTVSLHPSPETQESLQRENVSDEQMRDGDTADPDGDDKTWPTDEEIRAAEAERRRLKQKMQPGTSEYQSSWLLDQRLHDLYDGEQSEEGVADAVSGELDDELMFDNALERRAVSDAFNAMEQEREDDTETINGGASIDGDANDDALLEDDRDNAEEHEKEKTENERRKREREIMEDAEFPDEVETPEDQPARRRFSKYRALRSFRTTPWNARADLPQEYNKIFAFDSLRRAQKLAAEEQRERSERDNAAPVGSFIRLVLEGLSTDVAQEAVAQNAPLTALGLLLHEGKLSVNHYRISLYEDSAVTPNTCEFGDDHENVNRTRGLRSKDEIVVEAGFRRHRVRPIYSTDDTGDKHKFLRYLHAGVPAVASFYSPIMYPSAPGLVYTRVGVSASDNGEAMGGNYYGQETLVGTGRVAGNDPWRVVVKRAILTGIPTKVQKKKASVRNMFYSPDDVRYFKPVDLFTKHGKHGSIKEPVGTHGAMKCRFNAPVHQHDTVCLALYKRIFPPYPVQISQ